MGRPLCVFLECYKKSIIFAKSDGGRIKSDMVRHCRTKTDDSIEMNVQRTRKVSSLLFH